MSLHWQQRQCPAQKGESMKAYYNNKPEELQYMPLPSGKADVWIRRNIRKPTEGETAEGISGAAWEADEVYFRTSLDEESIRGRMDELYENNGEIFPVEPKKVSVEERLDAVEAAVSALLENQS